MDLDEITARQRMQDAMGRAAPAMPTDAAAIDVVRAARENLEREKRDWLMREPELLRCVGATSLDDLDHLLTTLVIVGFPFRNDASTYVRRAVTRDAFGNDIPTVTADRAQITRWLDAFDAIARRMGYAKSAPKPSGGRVAAIGAIALAAMLLG